MSTPPNTPSTNAPRPEFWRTLEEYTAGTAAESLSLRDEFPVGATLWPNDLDRRDFLKLLGGALALAGLSGCGQRAPDEIAPFVGPKPDTAAETEAVLFATTLSSEGYGRGVVVRTHEGRPTKIEGNAAHPESLGASDAMMQSAIWSLYDPERSTAPRENQQVRTWSDFESAWLPRQQALAAEHGRGFALLTEPTTSPSQLAEIHRLLVAWPEARWYQHTPLARYDLDGAQDDWDFSADVVLLIGGDPFGQHPAALRYSRAFAQRRRVENGRAHLNRLFVLEASPSISGTLADHRLPVSPARLAVLLDAIAAAQPEQEGVPRVALTPAEQHFATLLLRALRERGGGVVVAGPEQPDDVRRWARAMNARLDPQRRWHRLLPVVRSDGDARCQGDLAALTTAMHGGEIQTLWILGANPVYTAPGDVAFASALEHVAFTLHHGLHVDETAARCHWHLPQSHELETWGDARGYDGTVSLQQPVIAPRFTTWSVVELLRRATDPVGRAGYDIVREFWSGQNAPADFEARWSEALNRGVATALHPGGDAAPSASNDSATDIPRLASGAQEDHATVLLLPDAKLLDGRYANIPWLQELPHPITHLVWDNAAWISPALAAKLGIATGDMLSLVASSRDGAASAERTSIEIPAVIVPGQATDCIAIALGYGRWQGGRIGSRRGFNAYPLRTHAQPWLLAGATVRKASGTYPLVTTQGHFTMENRDLVHVVADDRLDEHPREENPSLFPAWPRGEYAWAMSIDLGTCTGCSACVVACQAENNIPSVGKEQVRRGREMLWLRVDRYYSGDPTNPRMFSQPVPCMHCENAPCEVVCPVGATVHSSEGLNDMVYNRCVGTRYCSNNCPYKVRRFNFLDYRAPTRSPTHLQENPDVTVRARGVMEKCTYCVQRIDAARITAEKEKRRVRDGELRTACQQACPTEAIVFGDLNDPNSRVSQRKREPHDYSLLAELNTRPRTTYLARVLPAEVLRDGGDSEATTHAT